MIGDHGNQHCGAEVEDDLVLEVQKEDLSDGRCSILIFKNSNLNMFTFKIIYEVFIT